jgi:DNA polymerase-3 subunit alpha
MGAKGSVRNSARALGYTTELGNKIAKHIPELPGITIQASIDASKELQELILKDSEAKHIIDIARKLEGLPNNIGGHASAKILSDISVVNYLPMMVSKKEGAGIFSQVDMKDVEARGLLKYDILGLETLDVIQKSVELIKKYKNVDIVLKDIDVNDSGIYKLLEAGHTANVFQFVGSAGGFIPQVKPKDINEISDLTSILRPGPMSMGMVERYANAKFKDEKYSYDLKDKKLIQKVWEICGSSYGLMIYQEQVILCFSQIAGFNEIEGDNARRAMGKKKPEEMASLEVQFVEGGKAKGYTEKDLKTLFKGIAGFAEYGFNKSHAICYSYITCQTAWLSYYYPLEFFVASMSISSGNTDKVRTYIKAVKERGFGISHPDINKSELDFIISDNSIIFGLGGIKGVGASVSKKIIANRPKSLYKGLGHFISRNYAILNSKILESYAKAGCFKCFGYNKETILQSIPYILEFLSMYKGLTQYNIFELCKIPLEEYLERCIIRNSKKEDDLSYEIDSLGLYITRHPMDDVLVNTDECMDVSAFGNFSDGDPFATVGCISRLIIKKTKAKTNMCTFDITSGNGNISCIMFPTIYSKFMESGCLIEGKMVYVAGKIKADSGKNADPEELQKNNNTLMVNTITGNTKLYICIVEKKDKDVEWIELGEVKSFMINGKSFGLNFNGKLKMLLEKKDEL